MKTPKCPICGAPLKAIRGYDVQAAIVHHKGIIARYRMEYPTKRHARWAQHLICTTRNHTRLRVFDELRAIIDGKEDGNDI